jgi:hypothetical protein
MSTPAIPDGTYDNTVTLRREEWTGGKVTRFVTASSISQASPHTTRPALRTPFGCYPDLPREPQPEGPFDRGIMRALAVAHGFKLKPQEGGEDDLHDYVYNTMIEVYQLGIEAGKNDATTKDLAALVARMARQMRKANPADTLATHALNFLRRKGLAGSPLRASE